MSQFWPIPGFSGTFSEAMEVDRFTNYLTFAGLAMITYDAFLTFEQEVRLVWHGRWGVPSVLYVLVRYGVIVQTISSAAYAFATSLSAFTCVPWNVTAEWGILVFMLPAEAMFMFRLSALYGNERKIAIPLWLLYTICGIVMLLATSFPLSSVWRLEGSSTAGCVIDQPARLLWTVWIPCLVLELTMVVLTISRSIQHRRRGVGTPLLSVLMRDGSLYFVVIFMLIVVNIVTCLITSVVYYSLFAQITLSATCILCSRLFLNLREIAYAPKARNGMRRSSSVSAHELHAFATLPISAPSSFGFSSIASSFVEDSFLETE